MRRWFLALWPDAGTREALIGRSRHLLPNGARGTNPLDLHLTLRFLGPLESGALGRAEVAAASIAGLAPISIRIDQAGCFPRSGVLWAGPSAPGPELLGLVRRLGQALQAQGFAPEPRPFRAHVTLARRVRRPPPTAWGAPILWVARELVLAAGWGGQVPRYRVHRSWTLTGDLGSRERPGRSDAASGPGTLPPDV